MKESKGLKKTQKFERRLADAKTGNEIEVLKRYRREIKEETIRRDASHNGFVKTCAQQQINQLKAERDAIEMEVVG